MLVKHIAACTHLSSTVKFSRNKRKRQPIGMLGRSSGNHDWLLANASACVSCGFRLRNASATQAIAFEWKPGFTSCYTMYKILIGSRNFCSVLRWKRCIVYFLWHLWTERPCIEPHLRPLYAWGKSLLVYSRIDGAIRPDWYFPGLPSALWGQGHSGRQCPPIFCLGDTI